MSTVHALDQIDSLPRGALRHDVVKRLLGAIFQGELPVGTRLVVQKLAHRFDVSSTPVREALLELEVVGLIQFVHNRGAVVKAFGREQLREIFHLRRILEAEAACCACGRLGRAPLERLNDRMLQLKHGDGEDWSERAMATDRRLHELIAAACGNVRLADEISRYDTLVQTVREIVGNRRNVLELALDDHLAIIDALLIGHAEAAARAMARHINRTARAVEAIMFSEGREETQHGIGP